MTCLQLKVYDSFVVDTGIVVPFFIVLWHVNDMSRPTIKIKYLAGNIVILYVHIFFSLHLVYGFVKQPVFFKNFYTIGRCWDFNASILLVSQISSNKFHIFEGL